MTHRNTWKQGERRIAKMFGTERTPLSGGNSKHTASDTLHERLYIEVKMRANHTTWGLFQDTARKAKKEGKIPIVALQQKNCPGCLLVVRPEDLARIAEEYRSTDESDETERTDAVQ